MRAAVLCVAAHLVSGHWRCQDGGKPDCDHACSDSASPGITTTDRDEEEISSPEFADAENPCSSSERFNKSPCTCGDGSTPTSTRVRAVCSDDSRPDCSGACPDGSDPSKLPKFLLKLTRSTPCPDDTFPIISRCRCD